MQQDFSSFSKELCMSTTNHQIMKLQKICRTGRVRFRIRCGSGSVKMVRIPDKKRGTTLPVCSSAGFACWRGRWWPPSRRGRPPSCPARRIASSWWPGRACCSVAVFAWPRGRKNCRESPKGFFLTLLKKDETKWNEKWYFYREILSLKRIFSHAETKWNEKWYFCREILSLKRI